jgi:RND family efflux transporter MFP subunit
MFYLIINFCRRRGPLVLTVGLFMWFWLSWVFSNPPTLISALKLSPQDAVTEVKLNGHVSARHTVLASPKIIGNIVEMRVSAGDHVTQGQVLAILRSSADSLEADRLARNQLSLAQAQLHNLDTDGLMSNQTLIKQPVTATLAVAKQTLATLQSTNTLVPLRSPITGIVTQQHQDVGDIAIPGQAVLTLAQSQHIEVLAPLTGVNSDGVKLQQSAHIRLETYPGQVFEGRVTRLDNPDHPQWVGVQLTANTEPRLLLGDDGHITVETNRHHQTLVIPLSSLVTQPTTVLNANNVTPQHASVYKLERDRAVLQPIDYHTLSDKQAMVLTGLSNGDWVVLDATKPVPNQTRLKPKAMATVPDL